MVLFFHLKIKAKWVIGIAIIIGFIGTHTVSARSITAKDFVLLNSLEGYKAPPWLHPDDRRYWVNTINGNKFRIKTIFHILRVTLASQYLAKFEVIQEELKKIIKKHNFKSLNFKEVHNLFILACYIEALHHDRTKVDKFIGGNITDRLAAFDGLNKELMELAQKIVFHALLNELNARDHLEEKIILNQFGMNNPNKGFMWELGQLVLDVVEVADKSDTHVYRSKELGKETKPASEYIKEGRKTLFAIEWEPHHWRLTNHLKLQNYNELRLNVENSHITSLSCSREFILLR